MGQYLLVLGGTGSIEGGTGQYMMVLGQYRSKLVDSWWYLVSIEWYWFIQVGFFYWSILKTTKCQTLRKF